MAEAQECELDGLVTSLTVSDDIVCVGTLNQGCQVMRFMNGSLEFVCQLRSKSEKNGLVTSSYHVQSSIKSLVYIRETFDAISSGSSSSSRRCNVSTELVTHLISDLRKADPRPAWVESLPRAAPLACDFNQCLILIGSEAMESTEAAGFENSVSVLDLNKPDTYLTSLPATVHPVRLMRVDSLSSKYSMLGVSDLKTGVQLYRLCRERQKVSCDFIYCIPVDEIRTFILRDDLLAVFHQFEPSVSLWQIDSRRTILCLNLQDQLRPFEEMDGSDSERGFIEELDDHVTAVTCGEADGLLVYGTRSGSVYGMELNSRRQIFHVPFAHGEEASEVLALNWTSPNNLIVCYHSHGVTVIKVDMELCIGNVENGRDETDESDDVLDGDADDDDPELDDGYDRRDERRR